MSYRIDDDGEPIPLADLEQADQELKAGRTVPLEEVLAELDSERDDPDPAEGDR